jgi:hypothetical protein
MKRYGLILAVGVAIFMASCGTGAREGERIVRRYNEALISAYRTGDARRLPEVAGERETRTIATLIEIKRSAGLVLEPVLESLEVVSVHTVGKDGMQVETREKWRYQDRSLAPGGAPGTPVAAEMRMRYDSERVNGTWKVMKVTTLENRVMKPAGS